jgi:uncharacterized protein
VQLSDGRWGAFEIKIGMNQVDEAAERLLHIGESAINKQGAAPIFLCVICGMSNASYKRPDGVYVVPITALKN